MELLNSYVIMIFYFIKDLTMFWKKDQKIIDRFLYYLIMKANN